jgi:pSer/pThr/pTyr-binding forkhead associated (FHA) protein
VRYEWIVERAGTTIATDDAGAMRERRVLLVAGEGHALTRLLPDGAVVIVGREPDCDVTLPHPKISRRHARFHGGPPVEVEDLGSTNGVRVGGRKLRTGERAALAHAESAQLGPFVAVVLETGRDATGDPPRAAIAVVDPTAEGVPEVARRVAQSRVTVLLSGETGAGKEVLARTLHQLSRRSGPFLAINCATLSEPLLESELFGYERGAFTGATASKPGLLEVARGAPSCSTRSASCRPPCRPSSCA